MVGDDVPVFALGAGYQDGAIMVALFGDCVGRARGAGFAGEG